MTSTIRTSTLMKIFMSTLMLFMLSSNVSSEETRHLVMPPTFNLEIHSETVLGSYPLGKINKQAAFSHHGSSKKEITLPNGKTGWVYDIGNIETHRIYILVFDSDDYVSDVLYYDHGRHEKYGISALLVQSKKRFPSIEKP